MSGILATFGYILGLGLGFLFGIVVLIYGAAKRQLAKGFLGFILTLVGTGIIGAVYPPLSLIAPIFIMAVLIRWIAGSVSGSGSQKEYQESKETENGSKVKKRSKSKYVIGAVGALIILGVIIGGTGTNSSNGKGYNRSRL